MKGHLPSSCRLSFIYVAYHSMDQPGACSTASPRQLGGGLAKEF